MPSAFFAFVQFLLNAMMLKSRKIGCFLPNFQRLRTEKKKKESGEAKKELQNYVIFAHKGRGILSCQKRVKGFSIACEWTDRRTDVRTNGQMD